MKKCKIAALLLALTLTLGGFGIVKAQTTTSLTISPPLFELSANPGDTINNTLRLENPTDRNLKISTELRNFTALGEEGSVTLTEEETSFSLASWIKVTPAQTTLAARSTQNFAFSVNVPRNAEPGGHFGSIVFKTVPAQAQGQGATVEQEIGALLLVKVAGDINEVANISSFDTDKEVYQNGPVVFESRIENKGNVHFKPTGTIAIKNAFGREVASVTLDQQNVLPDSIRKITTEWQPEGFRIGRYKADLDVVYGAEDNILHASVSFWIIPYKVVIPALLALLLVIFLLVRYRHRLGDAFKVLSGRRPSV